MDRRPPFPNKKPLINLEQIERGKEILKLLDNLKKESDASENKNIVSSEDITVVNLDSGRTQLRINKHKLNEIYKFVADTVTKTKDLVYYDDFEAIGMVTYKEDIERILKIIDGTEDERGLKDTVEHILFEIVDLNKRMKKLHASEDDDFEDEDLGEIEITDLESIKKQLEYIQNELMEVKQLRKVPINLLATIENYELICVCNPELTLKPVPNNVLHAYVMCLESGLLNSYDILPHVNDCLENINSFFIDYKIKPRNETDILCEIIDGDYYLYLPRMFNSVGEEIYNMYDKVWVTKHDGTVIKNGLNVPVIDIDNIRIYYPEFISAVKFAKKNDEAKSYVSEVSSLVTKNFTDMSYMFDGCEYLQLVELTDWNTDKVIDMSYMFNDCKKLKFYNSRAFKSFNTSEVTNMSHMFNNCNSLVSLELNFNTSSVLKMDYMFNNCKSLKYLNVKNFNTTLIDNFERMFAYCECLESLDLSSSVVSDPNADYTSMPWYTGNVTNTNLMFYNCGSLKTLNLSTWDTSNVEKIPETIIIDSEGKEIKIAGNGMFYGDYNEELKRRYTPMITDWCHFENITYKKWTLSTKDVSYIYSFPWNYDCAELDPEEE